jgi:hypothetical protein
MILKYGRCKVYLEYSYTDSNILGMTSEIVLGIGEFQMEENHWAGMLEYFGGPDFLEDIGEEASYFSEGNYTSTNSDLFIYYMHYIINTQKEYHLKLSSENIFWPVHDMFHALTDFQGGTFSCSWQQELIQFQRAYRRLLGKDIRVSRLFLEELCHQFNERNWGCNYSSSRYRIFPEEITTVTPPKP